MIRDLPDPPRDLWRIVGPGVVAAGVGISSGEFILWPYIASQAGLVFLWGAVLGIVTQFFLNMEIERYTLATGETVLTGFNRSWRHWGLVFAVMVYFANLWPGWALSSATLTTFLFGGGEPRFIAIGLLLVIGASLTLAPVVYVALERLIFVKVGAVATFAASRDGVRGEGGQLARAAGRPRRASTGMPLELGFALLFGAIAFAGAGGGQNLCQSNWIRDKGFGMGAYVPRLVSPLTGVEEAAATAVSGYIFETTPANMARWRRWWWFANTEQLLTFTLVSIATICLTSMIAHSTLYGMPDLPNSAAFLRIEGQRLQAIVGTWFGLFFWAVGAFSLFASSMGITDYTSRLAADVLKSTYFRSSAGVGEPVCTSGWSGAWSRSAARFCSSGMDQPLVLLVISASVGGTMMCLYSGLLINLNRRLLPDPIKIRSYRVAALIWSTVLFGALAAMTIRQQLLRLLGMKTRRAD